jgi:Coenzyme PQQ synthesis protein D (PqqD)
MKRMPTTHLPKMRVQGLVIDDLPDEILVYDLDRHKAHCLNRTAGLVWRLCDGQTRPAEIARRLQRELDLPLNEDLVWFALRQLDQFNLLEEPIALPVKLAGISRRRMMRNLGLAAAVAVPLITSLVAPTAAEAATCLATGAPCSPTIACCSPLGCNPGNHCH